MDNSCPVGIVAVVMSDVLNFPGARNWDAFSNIKKKPKSYIHVLATNSKYLKYIVGQRKSICRLDFSTRYWLVISDVLRKTEL